VTEAKWHVSVEETPQGFALLRGDKPLLTPMGHPLAVPQAPLAAAIAEEWQGQQQRIRKYELPLTSLACVAIDLAGNKREAATNDILPYAGTDLICYRAGDIPALRDRQSEVLDPLCAWAKERFGVALTLTEGVMPVAQPLENETGLKRVIDTYDMWTFAVLASCVKPLGSLILALALVERRVNAQDAFRLGHLEELYETEQWGADEEKDAKMRALENDLAAAERFLLLAA